MLFRSDLVTAQPASLLSERPSGGVSWSDASGHIVDFLRAIRSRRPAQCNPEVAHRAQSIVGAMTISARLGRKLRWDPVQEQFDCEAANRMMAREPRAPWCV